MYAGRGSSIGCASAWYADGRGFDPHARQHSFGEFGHEIIPTAILFLPLIQEEQLSVTGEKMCTKYRKDPKFSDRYAWANSADPDQTAPRGAV